MQNYTIRKKFAVEMAHRLMSSHTSSCQEIHGHSYTIEVFMTANTLNDDGMVVDFGEVKELIRDYINTWDHILVLYDADKTLIDKLDSLTKLKVVPYNPTAENMAKGLYDDITDILISKADHDDIEWSLLKIIVHETATGYAEYSNIIQNNSSIKNDVVADN